MRSTYNRFLFASALLGSTGSLALSMPQNQPLQGMGSSGPNITCAGLPSPFPTWQQLPDQSTMPDPFLPLK